MKNRRKEQYSYIIKDVLTGDIVGEFFGLVEVTSAFFKPIKKGITWDERDSMSFRKWLTSYNADKPFTLPGGRVVTHESKLIQRDNKPTLFLYSYETKTYKAFSDLSSLSSVSGISVDRIRESLCVPYYRRRAINGYLVARDLPDFNFSDLPNSATEYVMLDTLTMDVKFVTEEELLSSMGISHKTYHGLKMIPYVERELVNGKTFQLNGILIDWFKNPEVANITMQLKDSNQSINAA